MFLGFGILQVTQMIASAIDSAWKHWKERMRVEPFASQQLQQVMISKV